MAESRSAQAPKVPRGRWVAQLHRAPVRWDVLFHQLAEAIARRYWYTQTGFRQSTLKLDNDELWDAAMQMGRAFQKQTSHAGVACLAGEAKPSLFTLDHNLDIVVRDGTKVITDALLNYLEIAHNCFIPRNHTDLELLLPKIRETLRRFLLNKCTPDGELYPCIELPMGDDEGYFPRGKRPADPELSSGNPALDAYHLNILTDDEDGPATTMRKLVDFMKSDPLLSPEFAVEMVAALAGQRLKENTEKPNDLIESIRIRDRILFRPSRQSGKSPVQLFAESQLLASDQQKQRLERWVHENVFGIFRLDSRAGDIATMIDIVNDQSYQVHAEGPLQESALDTLVRMHIVPWDNQWFITGIAQTLKAGEGLRDALHPLRMRREADNNDPRLIAARKLVAFIHARFINRFGGDLAQFPDLDTCRTALDEFHHSLMIEYRLADGRQLADAWLQEVGFDFPPFIPEQFAANESVITSPGVIYDLEHGMIFISCADELRFAMTSPFPSREQKQAFARILLEKWRPGWIIRRLADSHPQRVQELLRELLGDKSFDVARNLESLLGRLKCPDHTLPARPVPFLMD